MNVVGRGAARDAHYHSAAVNHYEVLGVPVGAGRAEVRRAYLDAARRHHPDFHVAADASTRAEHAREMQAVNRAWAVLGDTAARASYDRELADRDGAGPSGLGRGPAPGPQVPPGKGWTPRRDDDGWMDDFSSWAGEDERLAPDEPATRAGRGDRGVRGVLAVLPVALFVLAVGAIALGVVLGGRPLVALGLASLVASATLFVLLPILAMSRGRHRD